MKLSVAHRVILASVIAAAAPELVSARRKLAQLSRSLSGDTCDQLVDSANGRGHLLSLKLTQGGNDSTNVQSAAKTYHEHGSFAATAEWYSDVCGDYSLSCSHHECLMGLYFVPCKDDNKYETTDGEANAFSINGFTSLQLQGTTELAFRGATSSLLECVANCDATKYSDGGAGGAGGSVYLDTELFEVEWFDGTKDQVKAFDASGATVSYTITSHAKGWKDFLGEALALILTQLCISCSVHIYLLRD